MLEEGEEGMVKQLPEDVLASILRRLAPRYLATSRCVCKAWRAIIDGRRLLRADLLPLSVAGIFIKFHDLIFSEFFARPTTGPRISGSIDYLGYRSSFRDHCNGLLLLRNCYGHCYDVVNPATRQWARSPPRPTPALGEEDFGYKGYLVFDPTVSLSPHYEVFVVPYALARVRSFSSRTVQLDPAIEGSEWPPTPFVLQVFSSRTGEWEERSFVREGDALGTVADMRRLEQVVHVHHNAAYWRGALYVHWQTNFVMRISLSEGKYRVANPPGDIELEQYPRLYLGKSEKGVYCALDGSLRVYLLNESNGQMDWVSWATARVSYEETDGPGPWTLQDINYSESDDKYGDGNDEAIEEQKFEWDSDNDNIIIDTENRGSHHPSIPYHDFGILGFHPYKEVVFVRGSCRRGFACHLNSRKVQDLGNIHPTNYGTGMGDQPFIEMSFPYTPWMGEFPGDSEFGSST